MKELLGDDGAKGTIGAELTKITTALTGGGGIKSIIDTAAGNAGTVEVALNVSAKYTELTAAVTAANKAIDEKLDAGDLTQLDTSNLKALKSSINGIQSQLESTFADFGLNPGDNTAKILPSKAKELQEAFKAVETSDTELGEKAGGVATSSQKQVKNIGELK